MMNDVFFMTLCIMSITVIVFASEIADIIISALKTVWRLLSSIVHSLALEDADHKAEVEMMERYLKSNITEKQIIKEDTGPSFSKFDID